MVLTGDINLTTVAQKTLLCVDDEPSVLRSLKRLFRTANFHVLTADSCAEAFALLEQEPIQIVLSDQRMPDMCGTEFLQQVKEKYPLTVRVILSGYSDVNAILGAINRGEVYRFIGKPWDDDELKTTVKQCFQYYDLQHENAQLLAQLHQRNEALNTMNLRLETLLQQHTDTLQLTQNVIECLPMSLFGVDAEGVVVMANVGATRSLPDLHLGEVIDDVFSPPVVAVLRQCLAGEAPESEVVCCEYQACSLHPVTLQFGNQMQGCLVIVNANI